MFSVCVNFYGQMSKKVAKLWPQKSREAESSHVSRNLAAVVDEAVRDNGGPWRVAFSPCSKQQRRAAPASRP